MRIEVTQPAREEFYKEIVSLSYQYKKLQKNPKRKLKDSFKSFRNNLIAAIVLLFFVLIELVLWGMDTGFLVLAFVLIALAMVYGTYLKNMKSVVSNMRKEYKSSFVVDEGGIEVNRENSLTVRIAWDKVHYVRCFHESVSFIPKETPGFILSIQKEYKEQVYDYLREAGKESLIVE